MDLSVLAMDDNCEVVDLPDHWPTASLARLWTITQAMSLIAVGTHDLGLFGLRLFHLASLRCVPQLCWIAVSVVNNA
jgi:hypothetical protein